MLPVPGRRSSPGHPRAHSCNAPRTTAATARPRRPPPHPVRDANPRPDQRDRHLQHDGERRQPDELPRQPVTFPLGGLQGGARRRQRVRARRERDPDERWHQQHTEQDDRTQPALGQGNEDDESGCKREQRPSAIGEVEANAKRDGRHRRDRSPEGVPPNRDSGDDHEARYGQEPQRVPVSDRLRQLIARRRVVRSADRPRGEPRPERVDRNDGHAGSDPSEQRRHRRRGQAQNQRRRRREVQQRSLGLGDRHARARRPQEREQLPGTECGECRRAARFRSARSRRSRTAGSSPGARAGSRA